MSSFDFRVHGDIGELEAAMARSNKVSPASPPTSWASDLESMKGL
jgi:hypothetical protein